MKFTIYQESRPGKRPNNEDRLAHCYSRDALMMVIADGMGGHYYGEIAAQIAVQTLQRAGVISGMPDGSFQPYGTATREQACTMLCML